MWTFAKWMDRTSVALIVAAAGSGMLLGGGVSVTARSVFALLAAGAFLASVAGMLAEGRWRIVKSPLLLLPIVLAIYALAQLAPLPGMSQYRASSAWVSPTTDRVLLVSANRHATLQSVCLLFAMGLLAAAAAQQLRTPRRLRFVGLCLAGILVASCIGGAMQQSAKNRKVFGMFALNGAAPAVRDVFSTETAIGLTAYQPWEELPASRAMKPGNNNSSPFFSTSESTAPLFAGFLHPNQWTACVVVLLPLLLAFAAQFANQAAVYGRTEWLTTWEGKRALVWLTLVLLLASLATWFGDPIAVPLSLLAAVVFGAFAATGPERLRAIKLSLLACVLAGGVGVIRVGTNGGVAPLLERVTQANADDRSLVQAFSDHRWFGCGLGAVGDLWSLYRPTASDQKVQVSSLLASAVELGWIGLGILGVALAYAVVRWLWVRGRLDPQNRIVVAGLFAGFGGLLAMGAMGPGMEAPVILTLAALMLGCLARGLAGGYVSVYGGLDA